MLKVYRVVGPDGIGYYFSQNLKLELSISDEVGYDTAENKPRHPLPKHDGIPSFPDHYHFGFGDKNQLKEWFTPDILTAADKRGCMVEIWEVPPHQVLHGGKQLCFNKGEAKLINKVKPLSFVKVS